MYPFAVEIVVAPWLAAERMRPQQQQQQVVVEIVVAETVVVAGGNDLVVAEIRETSTVADTSSFPVHRGEAAARDEAAGPVDTAILLLVEAVALVETEDPVAETVAARGSGQIGEKGEGQVPEEAVRKRESAAPRSPENIVVVKICFYIVFFFILTFNALISIETDVLFLRFQIH